MSRVLVILLVMLFLAQSLSLRTITTRPRCARLVLRLSRLSSTTAGIDNVDDGEASASTSISPILEKAIADLSKKRSTISKELERVREDKNAKDQAELILGSLYMIPEDPELYVIGKKRRLSVVRSKERMMVDHSLLHYPSNSSLRSTLTLFAPHKLFADVMDYEKGENVQIRLPEPKTEKKKNGRGEGGRDGAKYFAEARFKQSKKGKRGEGVLDDLLKKIDKSIGVVEGIIDEEDEGIVKGRVEKACAGLVKVNFGGEEIGRKKGAKPAPAGEKMDQGQNYRKYLFPVGAGDEEVTHTILVGRNRRQNENLSFRAGKNGDIWMHARGAPGAHVVVKARNRKMVWGAGEGVGGHWREALQFAANLAAFYSDLRTERKAEITLAEPKHITKPRGAPLGAVKLREEAGMILGDPFEVPEECREAREGGK